MTIQRQMRTMKTRTRSLKSPRTMIKMMMPVTGAMTNPNQGLTGPASREVTTMILMGPARRKRRKIRRARMHRTN